MCEGLLWWLSCEPAPGCLNWPARAHLLRHPAHRAQARRQLHRRRARLPGRPGARQSGDLLHRRPARDEHRLRPGAAAGLRARHHGDDDRRRDRPRALHPVPAVRRARALGALLAALLGHALRRPPAHAPVQGQVGARAEARAHEPVPVSGPAGGGHPALQDRRGAGGGRPAPARRAGTRDRAQVQHDLRRGARRAAARDPGGGRPHHGPAGAGREDVDELEQRGRARSTSTTSPTPSSARSSAPRPTRGARWCARPTRPASRT